MGIGQLFIFIFDSFKILVGSVMATLVLGTYFYLSRRFKDRSICGTRVCH